MKFWCFSSLLLFAGSIDCLGLNRLKVTPCSPQGATGDPLFLTPYIKAGRAADGRKAAQVPPILENIQSYSGYFTVNSDFNSNLFFWYFPAESSPESAPIALWLQGGPGGSSMFGLFQETGPISINNNLTVSNRKYSWTKDIHMIYIDNPVGTGFSFTRNPDGYVTNQEEVGRDLYSALIQFFQIFPELQSHDFYISGESYAGKYIPALAYTIHINNPTASLKINLKGMAIGDGLIDPENMMKYGDYLVQHGLVDDEGLKQFHQLEARIVNAIKAGRFQEASEGFQHVFKLLFNVAGNVDVYDYLIDGEGEISGDTLSRFLCQANIRKRIHVGDLPFNDGKTVQRYLELDMMKSVKPWFEVLLEHYKVLLYNGQLDIIVAYPLTVNFVKKLVWSGSDEYLTAKRKEWFVGDQLAGYSKSAGNFTELLVRDAGHMVPSDQPKWALNMMRKFVSNSSF
uniref:Carboxypeptidase n=1 Tax=Lygus hesperus TaxID=30085 RepID=A0A0A9W0I2_LYGHE